MNVNFKQFNLSFPIVIVLLFGLANTTLADQNILKTIVDGTGFSIDYDSIEQSYSMEILSGTKIEILDIFDLENPSRIIIDIKDLKIGENSTFPAINNDLITHMRLGKHSDKVRIVLDLKSTKIPKYTWEPIDSTGLGVYLQTTDKPLKLKTQSLPIVPKVEMQEPIAKEITLQKKEVVPIAKTALLEPPTQKEAPAKLPPVLNLNDVKVKNNEQQTEMIAQKQDQNPIKENTKFPNTEENLTNNNLVDHELGLQGLENIKFYYQKEKNTPLVRFILVAKPEYRLKKENEKRYILTIPNCNIRWPHLELPQFPPRDFKGFTMVMPEKSGTDLNIAIGVERGSNISSFTKDNEIWLKIG